MINHQSIKLTNQNKASVSPTPAVNMDALHKRTMVLQIALTLKYSFEKPANTTSHTKWLMSQHHPQMTLMCTTLVCNILVTPTPPLTAVNTTQTTQPPLTSYKTLNSPTCRSVPLTVLINLDALQCQCQNYVMIHTFPHDAYHKK